MAEIDEVRIKSLLKDSGDDNGDERIDHILSNLIQLASGNFNVSESENFQNDSVDAIDRGIVMLAEHLEADRVKQEKLLHEKESLLKEVHHRVKNNLQIISSLLNLQSSLMEGEVAHQLKQSQYRIRSMALIHEMLYRSENISFVPLKDYFEKIMVLLFDSIKNSDHKIEVDLKIPEVMINLDSAVSLGLLVNEIVTNALIHGLKDQGRIYLHFKIESDRGVLMSVGDNGIGFERQAMRDSLGLQLIEILSDQLKGSMELSHENGSHYSFRFDNPELIYSE